MQIIRFFFKGLIHLDQTRTSEVSACKASALRNNKVADKSQDFNPVLQLRVVCILYFPWHVHTFINTNSWFGLFKICRYDFMCFMLQLNYQFGRYIKVLLIFPRFLRINLQIQTYKQAKPPKKSENIIPYICVSTAGKY